MISPFLLSLAFGFTNQRPQAHIRCADTILATCAKGPKYYHGISCMHSNISLKISRCANNFCATHRYAETHDCTYDYKTAGRRFLQETRPVISAPKLPKI